MRLVEVFTRGHVAETVVHVPELDHVTHLYGSAAPQREY